MLFSHTNFYFFVLVPIVQGLRGDRNLRPQEWVCEEINVETYAQQFGFDYDFCVFAEELLASATEPDFEKSLKETLRTCCRDIITNDDTPECCRCNRQSVDGGKRFITWRSLDAQDECPAYWPADDYATGFEVAPGQVKKNAQLAMLLGAEP